MRITYRQGETLVLAEADLLSAKGSTLTAVLRNGQTLNFPFPSPDILEDFFRSVILSAGDKPIQLEFTDFDHRLGALLDDWDAMYE